MVLGSRGPAGAARAGIARLARYSRLALSSIRSGPDRDRSGSDGGALAAAHPNPLGHSGASRHAGPRDGRGAGGQPGVALHRRIRAGRGARGPGRRARDPAPAGAAFARHRRHLRRFRGRGRRRDGKHSGSLSRGPADRRDQGPVHRTRPVQAHPGRRVRGDGDRARAAAAGAPGETLGKLAPRGRCRTASPLRARVECSRADRRGGPRRSSARHDGLHAGPRDRHLRPGALRREPALHSGPRRHGVLRARGVPGLGRVRRGSAARESRMADGGGARRGADRRGRGRGALRLVLRAALGRLSRHADARLCPDRLVGRVSVGRADRRVERPGRRVAGELALLQDFVLLADARAVRGGRLAPGPRAVRALRLRPARRARLAAARGRRRHRRATHAVDRLYGRRSRRRSRGRSVRIFEGQHLARLDDGRVALDRRPGDGSARRRADADRLQDAVARNTDYWRAFLGAAILAMVLVFPQGIVGALRARLGPRQDPA